jgi:hypothetical protein
VDYHFFRKDLARELKKAGINIGRPPKGIASRYKVTPVREAPVSRYGEAA